MSIDEWTDPAHRTLQYVAASTPENEAFNRILLIVHGNERPVEVTLPDDRGRDRVTCRCGRARTRHRPTDGAEFLPGDVVPLAGTSMRLFRAE